MITALLIFVTSFVASFIFAGFETGLVSVNRLKVDHAKSEGDPVAVRFSVLLDQQSRVVSTVLIGNNLALVGMQSSFAAILMLLFGNVSAVIETSVLTIIALIFCELLPKSLFRIYSYKMSYTFSTLIWGLNILFTPLTMIVDRLTSLVTNESDVDKRIAVAELKAIATEGERKQELGSMVPLLTESVFALEGLSLDEFLNGIEGASERDCSAFTRSALYQFHSTDPANKLFRSGILFSGGVISVKYETGIVHYSCKSLFESLIFSAVP